ncbi:MAG: DUF2249 domain-containing protein [Bacteroidota bacterium]|nr:DUF2249 domain-containing protein [Bacteroidota bacterium]
MEIPEFISELKKEHVQELDVRPVIAGGKDPFSIIMERVKALEDGQILKIINTFEPVPLIRILEKQGFIVYVETISEKWIETYFFKPKKVEIKSIEQDKPEESNWETILHRFKDKLQTIDVRQLEMPLPMTTILETLENLSDDHALFVYHKRLPVFLLPELTERKFEFRSHETSDGEVELLIFKA